MLGLVFQTVIRSELVMIECKKREKHQEMVVPVYFPSLQFKDFPESEDVSSFNFIALE